MTVTIPFRLITDKSDTYKRLTTWNLLREENPDVSVTLVTSIRGAKLYPNRTRPNPLTYPPEGWNFREINFTYGDASRIDARKTDFSRSNLEFTSFHLASMASARFNRANCTRTVFDETDLTRASFYGTNLKGASFYGARWDTCRDTGVMNSLKIPSIEGAACLAGVRGIKHPLVRCFPDDLVVAVSRGFSEFRIWDHDGLVADGVDAIRSMQRTNPSFAASARTWVRNINPGIFNDYDSQHFTAKAHNFLEKVVA